MFAGYAFAGVNVMAMFFGGRFGLTVQLIVAGSLTLSEPSVARARNAYVIPASGASGATKRYANGALRIVVRYVSFAPSTRR